MMYISETRIDNKGRITLPKKFLEANDIEEGTIVKFQTIQGQNNTIKMIFSEDHSVSRGYLDPGKAIV
tara:strand:+ start:21304 stop:21507 length:204 start_codon:yes stop_codon:yes gene_type:complete